MSTITPSTPVGPDILTPFSNAGAGGLAPAAGAADAPPAGPSYTPLWLVGTGTGNNAFEMLGIRAPSANGDIAALLAEVTFTLEQTIDEARKRDSAFALAALAGAMAQRDDELVERGNFLTIAIEDTRETHEHVTSRTAPLKEARDGYNGQIDGLKAQIAAWQTQLAALPTNSPMRLVLQAQIAAAEGQVAGLLAQREAVDLELAAVRIDSLERQIVDLEAQLEVLTPESDEHVAVTALLDAKRDALDAVRSQVAAFEAGPKTEAARNAFSNANMSALESDTQALATRLAGHQQEMGEIAEALDDAAGVAMAMRAQLAAAFQQMMTVRDGDERFRDLSVEAFFESLLQEHLDFGTREIGELKALDQRADDSVADQRNEQLRAVAAGLVGILADLVGTLTRLESSAPPSNLPQPTVASRVRLEV